MLHISFSSYPSGETNIEEVSHVSVVMQWCTIMLKVTVFIRQHFDARYVVIAGIVKQAVPVTVASKKGGPNIPLEDTVHHTVIPGKLTAHSSITFEFSVAQFTHLC
jgi:hypothetical protein